MFLFNKLRKPYTQSLLLKTSASLNIFMGLEIAKSLSGTILNQQKFIKDILIVLGILHAKPANSPLPKGLQLLIDSEKKLFTLDTYRRLNGRLLYINLTRLDICYAIQYLSRFMSHPREPHLNVAHHVLRYLKAISFWGLYFPAYIDLNLTVYCDADWASCVYTRKSLIGFVFSWVVLPFLGK